MTDASLQQSFQAIHRDRVVEIARVLCSIPTPGMDEGLVADAIAAFLDRPGIELHVEPVVPGRSNLIATVRGRGEGPALILNGHTDATVNLRGWSHDPYDPWIDGNRMYGAGISDMKGAVASMVAAVEAATSIGPLPGDLILHAVMDHDTIGLGTKYIMASEAPWENCYGICGEPSALEIHTANSGAVRFEIQLTGREAHVSRAAEEGIDTLAAAINIYNALEVDAFSYQPNPRLPDLPRLVVGMMHGGIAAGMVAGTTVLQGDLRIVPGMNRTTVRADLERIVAAACPRDVQSRIRFNAVQNPFLGVTSGPLVDAIVEVHTAVRGTPPPITSRLPGQSFVTDAADMARAGIPTVVYGPADWHFAPDEFIDIDEMADAARIYLGTAIALAGKHRAA